MFVTISVYRVAAWWDFGIPQPNISVWPFISTKHIFSQYLKTHGMWYVWSHWVLGAISRIFLSPLCAMIKETLSTRFTSQMITLNWCNSQPIMYRSWGNDALHHAEPQESLLKDLDRGCLSQENKPKSALLSPGRMSCVSILICAWLNFPLLCVKGAIKNMPCVAVRSFRVLRVSWTLGVLQYLVRQSKHLVWQLYVGISLSICK